MLVVEWLGMCRRSPRCACELVELSSQFREFSSLGNSVYGLGFSLYSNLVASGLRVEGLAFSFRV